MGRSCARAQRQLCAGGGRGARRGLRGVGGAQGRLRQEQVARALRAAGGLGRSAAMACGCTACGGGGRATPQRSAREQGLYAATGAGQGRQLAGPLRQRRVSAAAPRRLGSRRPPVRPERELPVRDAAAGGAEAEERRARGGARRGDHRLCSGGGRCCDGRRVPGRGRRALGWLRRGGERGGVLLRALAMLAAGRRRDGCSGSGS